MGAGPAPAAAAAPPAAQPVPPALPGAPAQPAAARPAGGVPAQAPAARPAEEELPAGTIDWVGTDLDQVFDVYSRLSGRTVLRPANLPAVPIKLRTQSDLTRREIIQALDSVLALNAISMIPVGDKFVKAVPKAQAAQEGAPMQRLDQKGMPELGPFVTHIVQVTHVKPSELQQLLAMFASVGTANAVIPIDGSQTLVLRDTTENVKRMLELIREVDKPIPSEFVSEVIQIKYAKATDIANALSSLSSGGAVTSSGATARPTGATGRVGTTGTSRFGLGAMPGQPGVTPMGVTPTAPGAAGAQPSFQDRLQAIIKKASTTGTGDITVLGPTKIVADERANALLVFASREDMKTITNIVAQLDVVLPQVLIEAIIMDVQLGSGYSFGVSYAQGENATRIGNYFTGVGALNNVGFLSSGSFAAGSNALGALGRGLSYYGKFGGDFDATLTAAASDSRVTVIQKPRIMTFHATPASFFIGNTVPYVTSTYYGGYYGGYPSSQYQQLRVGIQLDVTPYINQVGLVVMEINQQIEEISGSTAIANVGDVPNTASRSLSAQVAVRDRETIILGGFIRTSDDKAKSGVPFLKDIPLLGYLFNKTSHSTERKELLVLMRPTVLRTPEVAAAHTAAEKLRLPGVSEAEAHDDKVETRNVERMKRRLGKDEPPKFRDVPPDWKPAAKPAS